MNLQPIAAGGRSVGSPIPNRLVDSCRGLTESLYIMLDLWLSSRPWRDQLRSMPLPDFLAGIERDATARGPSVFPLERFVRLVKLRLRVTRRWRHNRCLLGCLLLYRFMLRRGIPAALCFGVRLEGTNLLSHCWIASPPGSDLGCFGRPGGMREIYRRPQSPSENHGRWPTSS